jgi:hypothetical protein
VHCVSGSQGTRDLLAFQMKLSDSLCLILQVFDTCGLQQSPAAAIVSRLTLLGLRNNRLTKLPDALPAGAVHSLQVVDVSGSSLGQAPRCYMTAANRAAFSGSWDSLRVLGIRPREVHDIACGRKARARLLARLNAPYGPKATAKALTKLLRKEALAAQPPRLPPIVVYCDMHEELLWPADRLAVIE